MHTLGHDPNAFHEPLGFVDALTLLALASAAGLTLALSVLAIVSLLA
jgi:hypothetical protein